MIDYIEAQDSQCAMHKNKLFIAGGITNCPDWQADLVELLKEEDLTVFNPSCKNFDVNDSSMETKQIKWEHERLNESNIVSFWFPSETLCPITLYELGKMSMTTKRVFIGVDPEYSRLNDIIIQTGLIRPEIKIVYSIRRLSELIIDELEWCLCF